MDEQNNKKQETLSDLTILASMLLTVQKKSSNEVKDLLIEKGLDEMRAGYLISEIEYRIKTERKKAGEDIEKGRLVFIIGIAITGLTYLLSDYSNFYFITWGFIIYGAFLLLRGFSNWESKN